MLPLKDAGVVGLILRRGRVCAFGALLGAAWLIGPTLRADEWTPLMDKDLSQWDTYLSFRHKLDYAGKEPLDEAGKKIEPIGYSKDEAKVFSVVKIDGKSALRVSGEIYGCLFTKEEFSNYRLKLKVKWGEQKWDPRKEKLRDSGICYHSNGKSGVDYWRAWMLSQEFQIMEGHMGDYWNIANSGIDIRAFIPENAMNSVASEKQPFRAFGAKPSIAGFCLRSADYESSPGEWTELELVCFEGKSLHIVNGHVVMILQNSRQVTGGVAEPMTKGRIQLQSEGGEVYYTDIKLQKIDAMPAEFVKFFR